MKPNKRNHCDGVWESSGVARWRINEHIHDILDALDSSLSVRSCEVENATSRFGHGYKLMENQCSQVQGRVTEKDLRCNQWSIPFQI